MSNDSKSGFVRFTVSRPVPIEDGILLKPGEYAGKFTRVGIQTASHGTPSTKPSYYLELSAKQITDMDGKVGANEPSREFNVTEQVRSGLISIR